MICVCLGEGKREREDENIPSAGTCLICLQCLLLGKEEVGHQGFHMGNWDSTTCTVMLPSQVCCNKKLEYGEESPSISM